MRFLIDECLTIDLVSVAHQAGHGAQHVAHIGKAGWGDRNVARHAAEADFVLVTNKASDFRRRYATQSSCAGLVIIIPSITRERQRQRFLSAIEELAQIGAPVNRAVAVARR